MQEVIVEGLHLCGLVKTDTKMLSNCSLDHSDQNIDLNTRADNGGTAFILACYKGHKDVVQLLIDHSGIDLNVRDNTGRTALMIANQRGLQDIVHLLESK